MGFFVSLIFPFFLISFVQAHLNLSLDELLILLEILVHESLCVLDLFSLIFHAIVKLLLFLFPL